jgi:hypothetical protein
MHSNVIITTICFTLFTTLVDSKSTKESANVDADSPYLQQYRNYDDHYYEPNRRPLLLRAEKKKEQEPLLFADSSSLNTKEHDLSSSSSSSNSTQETITTETTQRKLEVKSDNPLEDNDIKNLRSRSDDLQNHIKILYEYDNSLYRLVDETGTKLHAQVLALHQQQLKWQQQHNEKTAMWRDLFSSLAVNDEKQSQLLEQHATKLSQLNDNLQEDNDDQYQHQVDSQLNETQMRLSQLEQVLERLVRALKTLVDT